MNYVLVLGIDASGKSTFLRALPADLGFEVIEPAETDVAQDFRVRTFRLDITPELIQQRREMFLGLNNQDEKEIIDKISRGAKVATSGGTLVTNISHDVMLNHTLGRPQDVKGAVDDWIVDENVAKPDAIVFLHADESVIKKRNDLRAAQDILETQIGFYSPEFLSLYQKAWFDVIAILREKTSIEIVDYDSGNLSPGEIVNRFRSIAS